MMTQARTANAVRAGVFVIGTILAAVAVVVVLAGVTQRLAPTSRYTVRFSLTDGAAGLEQDSAVRVGGRDVGRVVAVRFEEGREGGVTGVLVEIAIDKELVVREGAMAFLERPLLGSGATLNFETLGSPGDAALGAGGVIPGAPQTPQFMAQAGYGATQRQQLQDILARADSLTQRFDVITEDIQSITADARGRSGGWFERIGEIIEELRGSAEEMRARLADGRSLIESMQEAINANRENVDATIANARAASEDVREATAHFNDHTLALIDGLLVDGRDGAAEARAAIDRVDALVAEQTPALRRSMANARLASDQFRLAAGEIRRTPWRLLYRPSEKELEFELLYDAARAYADAVSDLRDAGESLEAVTSAEAAGGDLSGQVDRIAEAFESYRGAEERFLELLTERAP